MNKLIVILFYLLALSLEAATITNWGAQLPTAVPVGTDVILMQKGGVTYYFTPNQLAANIATNAQAGIANKIGTLNGTGTNTTLYGVIGNNGYRALLVPNQSILPSNHGDPLSPQLVGFTFNITSNYNLFVGNGGTKTTNTIGVLDPIDPLAFEINGSMNGVWNTFVGVNAGLNNVAGNENTFVGTAAGQQNVNGDQNTFIGNMAGISTTDGYHNTFVGTSAGQNNVHGYFNTRIGCDNGLIADGFYNTGVGASTGGKDIGSYNSWYGAGTAVSNTVGTGNSAFGAQSFGSSIQGEYNTALGFQSLALGGNLTNVTAAGYNSLLYGGGSYNTAMGGPAGYNPDNNIAQYRITSDSHITLLGYGATKDNAVKITNAMALGAGAMVLTNNQVVVGNDNITTTLLKGQAGVGTTTPGVVNGASFGSVGLHVSGASKYALIETTSGGTGGILLNDTTEAADSRLWGINLNGGSGLSFGTLNDAGATTQLATLARTGSLGIGTTTPGTVNGVSFASVSLHAVKESQYAVFESINTGNGGILINDASEAADSRLWSININGGTGLSFGTMSDAGGTTQRATLTRTGSLGIGTTTPLDSFHVVGGIVQTNGGIWQTWSLGAPSAPATQGAVYWNDGTNICAVFRNAGGALSTNKLSMTAWP